jgi:hypothetical protein
MEAEDRKNVAYYGIFHQLVTVKLLLMQEARKKIEHCFRVLHVQL